MSFQVIPQFAEHALGKDILHARLMWGQVSAPTEGQQINAVVDALSQGGWETSPKLVLVVDTGMWVEAQWQDGAWHVKTCGPVAGAPPSFPKGTCPKCGHRGEFRMMALACPEHGAFAGC